MYETNMSLCAENPQLLQSTVVLTEKKPRFPF